MQKPFSWTRKISEHIAELDAVPLFGNAPALDWEKLSEQLASRFETAGLKLGEKKQAWRTADELKEGLGESCLVVPVRLSPLEGHAFWLMPREHVSKLTGWMLGGQPLTSEILAEGFYRFLLLQTLDAASGLEPFKGLTLGLAEEISLPETDALCVDIQLSFEKRSCWGRLVIPPELQKKLVCTLCFKHRQFIAKCPGPRARSQCANGDVLIDQKRMAIVQEGRRRSAQTRRHTPRCADAGDPAALPSQDQTTQTAFARRSVHPRGNHGKTP